MTFDTNLKFLEKLNKIKKGNKSLFKRIIKQLKAFEINENHPSLRRHKLKGKMEEYWSISVDMNYRMIYFVESNRAIFVDIAKHDEIYRGN